MRIIDWSSDVCSSDLMSFADLAARLQPAVVNISTKQSIGVSRSPFPPGFEEFFRRFGGRVPETGEDNTITQRGGSLGSGLIVSADGDRKRGVYGKRVSVRLDIVGRPIH